MENLVKLLPVIAVVALVVIIFLLGYVKAPPDVAYIISGIRKRPRVLDGPGRHPARHEELSEYARSGFQLRHRGFSPGQYARNHRHHLSQGNLQ